MRRTRPALRQIPARRSSVGGVLRLCRLRHTAPDSLDREVSGSRGGGETVAAFVTIALAESGYDLYARRDPEAGMTRIAHIDAVSRAGEPGSETFLTVIWRDHLAAVALPQLIPT